MSQPTLFDAPVTRGASRQSDPQTSRDAGRSVSGHVLRDQQRRVLAAVVRLGDATAWDVVSWLMSPMQQNVASKRLGELAEMGAVELTGATREGSSRRSLQVWRATDAGRDAL